MAAQASVQACFLVHASILHGRSDAGQEGGVCRGLEGTVRRADAHAFVLCAPTRVGVTGARENDGAETGPEAASAGRQAGAEPECTAMLRWGICRGVAPSTAAWAPECERTRARRGGSEARVWGATLRGRSGGAD